MSESSYCPYCGSVVKPGDAFCNNCGASIEKQQSTTTSTPTTPVSQQNPEASIPQQTNYYGTQTVQTQQAAPQMNKAADNALVWGIVSIFCGLAGIPAILYGIQGMKNPYNKNKAVVGIVLGAIFLVGTIISIFRFAFWFY